MGLQAQSRARVGASCVGASLLALLATSGPAAAAPKPISGKLSKPGYTVIALAANGKAKAVHARRGRFRLRPPARRVTLHLRAPNGTYAGPIVVGRKRKGKRATVGVRAGAKLGRIKARRGYAKVSRRLRKKWVDASRTARARKGVPIGTRVFGRVRSRPPRRAIPGDRDLDGIPDQLDIDDDGDLVLDNLERSTAARTAQQQPPPPVKPVPDVFTSLYLDLGQTANANALALAGLTQEQIDQRIAAAVSNGGRLLFSGFTASTEFDCGGSPNPSPPPPWVGGLPYCTVGGTGIATSPGSPEFPECCDADNDGFGIVPPGVGQDTPYTLLPGTDQIKTGDQVIGHVATGGGVSKCPDALNPACVSITHVLQFVFATVPALASYHDTAGNSATLSYPYPAGPGEFPVAAGPDGQVRVTLTLWRPQRPPIPGEPGYGVRPIAWKDIGGLSYSVGQEGAGGPCLQRAYSEDDPTTSGVEDDPRLTLPTGPRVGLLGGLGLRI